MDTSEIKASPPESKTMTVSSHFLSGSVMWLADPY